MFLVGLVSKFVPVTVIAVPGVPIVGVNPVTVGAPVGEVTVKAPVLAAEPLGAVTPIDPVVAPAGTTVTIFVVVDDVTEAVTPLKVTVFWLGVAKPGSKDRDGRSNGPTVRRELDHRNYGRGLAGDREKIAYCVVVINGSIRV